MLYIKGKNQLWIEKFVNLGWFNNIKIKFFGGIAQLGEHLPCKQGVKSSNLFISTKPLLLELENLENCIGK